MLASAGGRLALRSRALRVVAFPSHNVRNYWWSKPESAPPTETVALPPTPPEPIGPSQVLPVEDLSTVSEVVANAIPPLQYGDFAALGLTSWWPSGIMSWSFELLQVTTGMPWFYTIVAGTLFWRAILIPSTLTGMRNAARLRPYADQIKKLDDQAQTVQNDRAAQMEIMLKKQKLIESAGVSMKSMFLPPVLQMVGNFGLFFAVKGMVGLPVVQLTQSGVWLLPDLTQTGYMMPALVALVMNVQLTIMKKESDPTKPSMIHLLNVMRVASVVTIPFMASMPSGLWLSMLTGVVLSTTQSALLRVPRIRQALDILPATPVTPVTMRDTGRMILEWVQSKRTEAVAKQAAVERKPNWTSLPKARRARRS